MALSTKQWRFMGLSLMVGVLLFAFTLKDNYDTIPRQLLQAWSDTSGMDVKPSGDKALTTTSPSMISSIISTLTGPKQKCSCKKKPVGSGSRTVNQFDTTIDWLHETTKNYLKANHPNLPVEFLYKRSKEGGCTLLPTQFSILWRNTYWQEAALSQDVKFLLYSATYDPKGVSGTLPGIRLLGVSQSVDPPKSWCQLWFDTSSPPTLSKIVKIEYLDYQSRNAARQMPYLMTCEVPYSVSHLVPEAVSLVDIPCNSPTNLLKVTGKKERETSAYSDGVPNPKRITGWSAAVCSTALYYYHSDFSARLVEWLELLKAEGIGRVFLYETDVHPNVRKVLMHYQSEGFVHVTKYSYPPPYINEPSTRRLWTLVERTKMFAQENVYFTDCILRHMHEYRFIAHYDPDEVPVLFKHDNYTHFLDHILTTYHEEATKKKKHVPVAYKLQWSSFYPEITKAHQKSNPTKLISTSGKTTPVPGVHRTSNPTKAIRTSEKTSPAPEVQNTTIITSVTNVTKPKSKTESLKSESGKTKENENSIPGYLWVFNHLWRYDQDIKATPGKFKALYDMDYARGVFSHNVLTCASGKCPAGSSSIKPELAYLAHFSASCNKKCKPDDPAHVEKWLLKFKDTVVPAIKKVLNMIGIK